ncbi:protein of unknown function [Xenorhabdus bovienii]|uniref:Uncharacterized protein n=1 Tax=Xenorhabdus bovienii TaxID=40576 RepID=A0A0B6X5Q2_XENBV|nr:protein of unknown function [Xenorhabdus bovienii]
MVSQNSCEPLFTMVSRSWDAFDHPSTTAVKIAKSMYYQIRDKLRTYMTSICCMK